MKTFSDLVGLGKPLRATLGELNFPSRESLLEGEGALISERKLSSDEIFAYAYIQAHEDAMDAHVFFQHLMSTLDMSVLDDSMKARSITVAISETADKKPCVLFFESRIQISITIMRCSNCGDITCSEHPGH